MVLDASLLNTQHYKVRIKGKVEQSMEGVAPSPTPWCSSYRKGSLRVTLDYGRQLYNYIYNHSSIAMCAATKIPYLLYEKDLFKTSNVMHDFIYNLWFIYNECYMMGMGEKPKIQ